MPIIDLNGKRMKDEDIEFLKKMLKGSLENHIAHFSKCKEEAEMMGEEPAFYDRIQERFRSGLDQLDEKIRSAKEGNRKIKAQDLITQVYAGIGTEVANQLKQEDPAQPGIPKTMKSFIKSEACDWGDKGLAKAFPDEPKLRVPRRDTDAAYKRTEEAFTFATEPLAGIEEIEDYDPTKDSVAALYSGRAGNSGTLVHTVEEHRAKLEGMREDDPNYPQAKSELEQAEEAWAGLVMGGETARGRSVDLRNKEEVSFGDLFETLSRLNEVVLPKNKQGGKLRGFGIIANGVIGSGTFVAPVNLYKTLSKIADGINQVKKVEDPALRKTRAVQLAAFSYQMLVSEHVFADGNGRTCRLFADTILQTFGLPPHTPVKDKVKLVHTMGEAMDFNAGADTFFEGIQKSNRILREERKKAPEVKEEKVSTRKSLLSEIRKEITTEGGRIAESETYKNYIRAMEALDVRMEELGRKDAEEKEHILTGQEKEDLLAKMVRVAETGERFLDSGKAAGKDVSKGVFGMVSRLQTMVSKDYDTINEYKPENPRSLNQLQEDSRTVTIDLRNRNIKTLGHMTSTRIPMTIYGVNGKRRTGVFTKSVKTDVMTKYNALIRKAAKGCPPAAVQELTNLIPKMRQKFVGLGLKKYDGSFVTENDPPEVILGKFLIYGYSVRKKNEGRKLNNRDIRAIFKECGVRENRIPEKAIDSLREGLNELIKNPVNNILTLGLELPNDTRMDQRNTAMSVVAGLLGAGSLLARSDSVRCIDKDGTVTEGTFMDFGKGLDLKGDKSLIRHLREDPLCEKKHRNAVVRSLADLQIIDYLCLNVDRHAGNMMYQVDAAGNVTGIQGIDNDSSFGRRKCGQVENSALRVISKSMAEKVKKLSPEMMRFALRGRGLTDEEVTAAVNRLDDLKSLIRDNTVREVRDDRFADLTNAELFPVDNKMRNAFKGAIKYINEAAHKRISKHIPFESYVDRPVNLSKVSTADRKYTVGGLVDLSESAKRMLTDREADFDVSKINSFGRRSNEFTELLDAVRNVSNIPEFLRRSNQLNEEKYISELHAGETLMVFDEAFNALNEKVRTYLRKKTRERGLDETGKIKGKNDYEKKRIEYAKNVLSLVKEYTDRRVGPVKNADKLEEQALKNRRDQNIRNKAPGL